MICSCASRLPRRGGHSPAAGRGRWRGLGREGLLAHPFMMGDNGDSNGCVSIKDYNAFLKAYQDGKIKRLAVIAKAYNS